MHKQQGQLVFSPSDLTRFLDSPFASWMERFALECPQQAPARDAPNALLNALAQEGYAQESTLAQEFIDQGRTLVQIAGATNAERFQATLSAMTCGVEVIIQARLQAQNFAGFADFLVRVPGTSKLGDYHYEVWDSKLAGAAQPAFALQLCCYADMLESMQGQRPQFLTLALGDGSKQRLPSASLYHYYQSIKAAFLATQQAFDPQDMPDPADSKHWGDWSDYAEQLLRARDHLFQVAQIRHGQIKKLNQAGILTLTQLAQSSEKAVPGVALPLFSRLKAQAQAQLHSRENQLRGDNTPYFELLPHPPGEKTGLALLPPHSALDVFFDIEGFPLEQDGLEYLWGSTYFDAKGERQFKDFWAHNPAEEKQAFADFIHWVYARWQQDPAMHIYHYANYEISACRRLMGHYGICEYEVDQLLRNEVFVDLYKIVKGALLLGEPRYSIKNVEHLYRGQRATQVGSGGDSVLVYQQWRELYQQGLTGADWQSAELLRAIRDYNIDDCDSTQELTAWLRSQQKSAGIAYLGAKDIKEPELSEVVTERTQLRDRLLQRADMERSSGDAQASLSENLAWILEFHRRENKPMFWRMFDRLGQNPEELMDDLDCLAHCQRTEKPPFKPTPKARNPAYEYRFDPNQEFRGAKQKFYLLGVDDGKGNIQKANWIPEASDLDQGLIALQSSREPPALVTLVPDEYVNPDPIPQAIDRFAQAYVQGRLQAGSSALFDFLSRAKPRIKGHQGAITKSDHPETRLQELRERVRDLDQSYLPIQGPPGAGKSYTGKQLIADLLRRGARVGIASNSHKAINHLLINTARFCQAEGIAAHFGTSKEADAELSELGIPILKSSELAASVQPACVLGGTAWGFAREDMLGQLDYLFVDEAGQVSVANLIAMGQAARNLVLMGDQMQLGQPSQGVHPAESGLSVLDYLLHDQATIAPDSGVFLGTTFRLHARINAFISTHIYEGKLHSHPDNDRRIIEVPPNYQGPLSQTAGLHFIPVPHEGNSQASDEEVAKIAQLAETLLGRVFHTGEAQPATRPIGWQDMLFVAPYNHQVSRLKATLGPAARVGSVDKFQGQEAPIVFLSLCSSDASESPRGLDFLFDPQRLNVALSRAQCLAIVVGNPALAQTPVTQMRQLQRVNLLNAIIQAGSDPL